MKAFSGVRFLAKKVITYKDFISSRLDDRPLTSRTARKNGKLPFSVNADTVALLFGLVESLVCGTVKIDRIEKFGRC